MFIDSNYVRQRETAEKQQFDNEMAYRNFKQEYKRKIEDGLTKSKLMEHYNCSTDVLEMFDRLKAEMDEEQRLGEAFLAGFSNPDYH